MPDISDLFDDIPEKSDLEKKEAQKKSSLPEETPVFPRIEKPKQIFTTPRKIPQDEDYTRQVFAHASPDISEQLRKTLQKFLAASDSEEKSDARNRLIAAYWNFIINVVENLDDPMPLPMQYLLRFGYLSHQTVGDQTMSILQKVVPQKTTDEPIYYQDEWLLAIAQQKIKPTSVEEVSLKQMSDAERQTAKSEKIEGLLDIKQQAVQSHSERLNSLEHKLNNLVSMLMERSPLPNIPKKIKGPYTEGQRKYLTEISSLVREMSITTRQLDSCYKDYHKTKRQQQDIAPHKQNAPRSFESGAAVAEINLIRQMAKLSVGRSGNHFPFLSQQYLVGLETNGGFREQVLSILSDLEYLDSGIFLRTFRDVTSRIVPYIILIPTYGNYGLCWEPFERFNRASGRGKVAIPMYPQDIRIAIATALGDLRWQVAKEKASRFWMEEGLTGWYYDYYVKNKLKGEIKIHFIQDYILWLIKESEGTQKLNRELRDIFWRYIPFPEKLKEQLSKRGFVYSELYKKDKVRSLSSMY